MPEKVEMVETSNTVCPDLVPSEFGLHKSFVKNARRYWTFEQPEVVERFMTRVEAGHFRRQKRAKC